MPSDRSAKSASVVPTVVVAMMVVQYRIGWNRLALICAVPAPRKIAAKTAVQHAPLLAHELSARRNRLKRKNRDLLRLISTYALALFMRETVDSTVEQNRIRSQGSEFLDCRAFLECDHCNSTGKK